MKAFTIAFLFIISFAIIIGLAITAVNKPYSYGDKIDRMNEVKMETDSIEHANFIYVMSH